jgi:hypothetical protein
MEMRWFRPIGPFFYPVSAPGWTLASLVFAFCAHIFLFFDHRAHSVTDLLYGIFPYWGPALLALAWIADRTGGRASGA